MHHDPQWPRASEWLQNGSTNPALLVLGVPLNQSISPGHCDEAPKAIRDALALYSLADVEEFQDLSRVSIADQGDLDSKDLDAVSAVGLLIHWKAQVAADPKAVVYLGGDNSVTRPGVHSLGQPLDRIGLITLDAHFDLRHTENGLHNGNPIRALLADGLHGENIVQIGIQSFANSPAYAAVAAQEGIQVITAGEVHRRGIAKVVMESLAELSSKVDSIYVDLDIDVLDRAFCPGAPGARPGGLLPHQVREFAFHVGAHPSVSAMDLVEFDPRRDINQVTALSCAACLLSFASGVASRG